MKKYNEIHIGDNETLKHTITQEDMDKFVQLTGDDNKLHVDAAFASKTAFKKPVVHGMLGASFISTIIGTRLPGDGALWFSQSLEFLLPVRLGDTLTIRAEVIRKNDKEQFIELKTDIYNQNKQIVTKGISKVKVLSLDEPKTAAALPNTTIKTALVIGGTGGIGEATCRQLARDGMQVAIHYHKNKAVAHHIKEAIEAEKGSAIVVQADILQPDEIKAMLDSITRTWGGVDVLVNCAATVIPNIKFLDLEWEDYEKQLNLNLKSAFNIVKAIVPYMIARQYGKIIHLGSMAIDKPNTEWSPYITAKSALAGFTKSLAIDLAPKGIRVNMVTPGMVNTELTADIPEKIKLLAAAQTPLRRLALVKDVADAISFLASGKSDFLAGENIRVNGGQVMI